MGSQSCSFPFLGTMAGNQTYVVEDNQKSTYCRVYEPFGSSDELREKITKIGIEHFSEGYKNFGEDYSFTSLTLNDGRFPKPKQITYLPGGGFFLTREELQDEKKHFTSFEFALSKFQKQFAQITDIPMKELLAQCSAYGINYFLNRYFDCVETPEEGDLVVYKNSCTKVYPNTKKVSAGTPTHAGIYRKSNPNWNSPPGGTVESKWESWTPNPYVFQHDVFFVPDYYGDRAKFYRFKNKAAPSRAQTISISSLHTLLPNGTFLFNRTLENEKIRNAINNLCGAKLVEKFPEIEWFHDIDFWGVCYNYAFGKVFKTFRLPSGIPLLEGNTSVLTKYFTPTTRPTPGDLVIYYTPKGSISHYGVYCENGLIESKWGTGSVYKHPPFYVPNMYGDTIVYYKIRADLTPETLVQALKDEASSQKK